MHASRIFCVTAAALSGQQTLIIPSRNFYYSGTMVSSGLNVYQIQLKSDLLVLNNFIWAVPAKEINFLSAGMNAIHHIMFLINRAVIIVVVYMSTSRGFFQ